MHVDAQATLEASASTSIVLTPIASSSNFYFQKNNVNE